MFYVILVVRWTAEYEKTIGRRHKQFLEGYKQYQTQAHSYLAKNVCH